MLAEHSALLSRLGEILDDDGLISGIPASAFSTDIYRSLVEPIAVIRPASVEALRAAMLEVTSRGIAVFPRGGGASYTDGYLPDRREAVIIDTGRLDRIIEINEADAYVTVQAGVTWANLKAALDPLGLRTPFFGPFSGIAATVGGSMSQNSLSHGSGAHGVSAASALSFDVVCASGALIRTGSASCGAAPFARHHGPDLTGLFTGDCGAFGIKVSVTLPLLQSKPASGCVSIGFETMADLAGAMRRMAMEQLDDEHFAIDAALAQGQIARARNPGSVFALARTIFGAASSPGRGLARLAGMAASGSSAAVGKAAFTLHAILDGVSAAEVAAKRRRILVLTKPGRRIADVVPKLVQAMPFAPLFNVLGPNGERWVPVHGILPHSKVAAFHAALQELFAARAEAMTSLGVWTGGMYETVGPSGFLYEVALYWPGAWTAYHRSVLPADHLARLPTYPDRPEINDFVHVLKQDIVDLYESFGAAHFQIGRLYAYATVLDRDARGLVQSIKQTLDPQHLMNPCVLGL